MTIPAAITSNVSVDAVGCPGRGGAVRAEDGNSGVLEVAGCDKAGVCSVGCVRYRFAVICWGFLAPVIYDEVWMFEIMLCRLCGYYGCL